MRKYGKTGKLETVICNMCGKKIVVKDGIVREGDVYKRQGKFGVS